MEAVQTVVGRAVAQGHRVRVLGTEGLRSRFESAGATFVRYKYAPDNDMSKPESDLVKDWQSRNPVSQWRRVRAGSWWGRPASSAATWARNWSGIRPMSPWWTP